MEENLKKSLEAAKELLARLKEDPSLADSIFDELAKKSKEKNDLEKKSDFKKLSHKIQNKEGISKERANAITASIGRKKLGEAEMARRSAEGRKHAKAESDASLSYGRGMEGKNSSKAGADKLSFGQGQKAHNSSQGGADKMSFGRGMMGKNSSQGGADKLSFGQGQKAHNSSQGGADKMSFGRGMNKAALDQNNANAGSIKNDGMPKIPSAVKKAALDQNNANAGSIKNDGMPRIPEDVKKGEIRKCLKSDERLMSRFKKTAPTGGLGSSNPDMMRKAANPDKDADAELGERVEHDVERHMLANKAAERKEGHQIVKKKSLVKERMGTGGAYAKSADDTAGMTAVTHTASQLASPGLARSEKKSAPKKNRKAEEPMG